jgi:hypothetical protein
MNCIYCQSVLKRDFYSDSKTLKKFISCIRDDHTFHSTENKDIQRLYINDVFFSYINNKWIVSNKYLSFDEGISIKDITKEKIDKMVVLYKLLK